MVLVNFYCQSNGAYKLDFSREWPTGHSVGAGGSGLCFGFFFLFVVYNFFFLSLTRTLWETEILSQTTVKPKSTYQYPDKFLNGKTLVSVTKF